MIYLQASFTEVLQDGKVGSKNDGSFRKSEAFSGFRSGERSRVGCGHGGMRWGEFIGAIAA